MLADLRLVLRSLAASPAYALLVVVTLALGIGATTAVFSVVDGVLLRPLGYREPERLVGVASSHPQQGQGYPPSYPDFLDWRAQARSLAGAAFARGEALLLRGAEGAERVTAAYVTEGFFPLLGTRPLLGRAFHPEEERAGGAPVVVLSHALWRSRFGGDPAIVGRRLDFAEGSYTVVGVMPAAFTYPGGWAQLWTPLAPHAARFPELARRGHRVDNRVVARLAPGVTLAAARAELAMVGRRLAEAHPGDDAGWRIDAEPLRDDVVGDAGRPLAVLLGAVGLVLLIACADVANLALVRASARRREAAVRAALGAGRWRLARPFVLESLALGTAGGLAGVGVAAGGVALLERAAPAQLPRLAEVAVDGRALLFATALTLLVAVAAGVLPALLAATRGLGEALKDGSRGAGAGTRSTRLRSGLVVAQMALALALLVGAGLLVRSFVALQRVDVGLDPDGLLVLRVEPPEARYDSPEKLLALYDRVRDAARAVPGVRAASFVNHLPLTGAGVVSPVDPEGRTLRAEERNMAMFRLADADYFATVGQPIVRGRPLAPADMTPTAAVVVVNETLARRYWPDADPIGRRLTLYKQAAGRPDFQAPIAAQVVGVVKDVKVRDLGAAPPAEAYLPFPVNPWRSAYLMVRATGDAGAVSAALRRAVAGVDADIPVTGLRSADALLALLLAERRFTTWLLGAFAGAALLLAAVGLYGVLAYAVARRAHELGVRAALGAAPGALRRMVLGEGLRLALLGVAIGLALAAATTRALGGLLYGVGRTDVPTFAAVAGLLTAVALLASWVPARRATRVDPAVALRGE